MRSGFLIVVALHLGCAPPAPDIGYGSGSTTGAPASTSSTGSGATTSSSGASSAPPPGDWSGASDDSGDAGWPDIGQGIPSCDLYAQDCPPGEKCMPYSDDGGPIWNATRCVEIARDPGQLDDPCTFEQPFLTGVDSCDLGLICFFAGEDGVGTCIPLCSGPDHSPTCPEGWTCWIAPAGPEFCGRQCDPLLPVCPEGQACHAINETFTCHWEDWGRPGVHGDPCSSHYDCGPGHTCIGADAHTECPGSGCCSTLCDHTDPTGDDACAAVDRNQGCEPWYLEGMAPEGYEELGVCALPG